MFRSLLSKLAAGLVFALPLALVSYALAQASVTPQAAPPAGASPNCQDCHASIQAVWETGTHSQALTEANFKAAWDKLGGPKECLACHTTGFDAATGTFHAEGVTCAACHDSVPAEHPLSPASMSRSAELCGTCHTDTLFQWKSSQHGQSDLTCVSCHDPHANTLRAKDTSTLCADCHGTRVASYGHTAHATQGLTCTDCHIGEATDAAGMGQSSHSHTFAVDLGKCNSCHSSDLHSPSAAMLVAADGTPVPPDAGHSATTAVVSAEPQPVSPIGYALVTGLLGLAFGIVLAPWLERGFRRVTGSKPAAR